MADTAFVLENRSYEKDAGVLSGVTYSLFVR